MKVIYQVLVVGGGVIGNLLVQAMRALDIGCSIAVSEPSSFHAQLAVKAGADHLITDGAVVSQAGRITGAKAYKPMLGGKIAMGGFNKIFDTVGSTGTIDASLRALRSGGALILVGISKDVMTDLTPLWLKLQTIKGVFCYGYTEMDGELKHVFELAIDLAERKKVDLESMITHTFTLDDYKKMIGVNLNKGKHGAVKTAVTFVHIS